MAWVNETINLVERAINEGGHEAISIPDEEGEEEVAVAEEAVVVPSEQPNLLMGDELFGSFDFDKDEKEEEEKDNADQAEVQSDEKKAAHEGDEGDKKEGGEEKVDEGV